MIFRREPYMYEGVSGIMLTRSHKQSCFDAWNDGKLTWSRNDNIFGRCSVMGRMKLEPQTLCTTDTLPYPQPFCDIEQTAAEGSNLYGRKNIEYPVLETYEEGSVIEMKIVFSTYHNVSS